jgi:hypothetical protein
MTKTNLNKKIVITAVLLFSLFTIHYSLFTWNALAQQRIPLVVAPARQTVALDAGKSENLQIKFFNESTTPISGNLKAVDFIVTGNDGSPILLEDQVNTWVKLPFDRASIASGDVLRVNFKVEVPKDAQPGGKYVAIIFEQTGQLSSPTTENEGATAISPRIVGLLNIRVNGPVVEYSFIDKLKVPSFLEFGPVKLSFDILNKGGYHINPKGQVTLTDWTGKEVDRVTIDDKNIFPDTSRSYSTKIGKTWMFGKYSVDITAAYGETGKTLTESKFVWIVPVTVILLAIFSILIIIFTVYLVSQKIKAKQVKLEEKLEEEISDLEALKNKFKDKLPK